MQWRGQDSSGTCPACAGTRKLQVILPGPKHPVNIKGSVRDLAAYPNGEVPGSDAVERAKPFQPLQGAVHDASLVFKGPGGNVDIAVQATGRFRCALDPGDYSVTVSAKDFKASQQSLAVPPLKQPVWQVKGHLREPDKDAETLIFNVLLSH